MTPTSAGLAEAESVWEALTRLPPYLWWSVTPNPDDPHERARWRTFRERALRQAELDESRDPAGQAALGAIRDFLRAPSVWSAHTCVSAIQPLVRLARRRERRPVGSLRSSPVTGTIGPYVVERLLGAGHDGLVLEARRAPTTQPVALKVGHFRGDRACAMALGACTWPSEVLALLEFGCVAPAGPTGDGHDLYWVAREYADSTLHDDLVAHRPLDALAVFGAVCRGVAWLHAQGVYSWSAHSKNIYRVGERWAIGDLGRCLIFRESSDAVFDDYRAYGYLPQEESDLRWGGCTATAVHVRCPERELRLRLNDCSGLAVVLCLLLNGGTWGLFLRALRRQPLCSGPYVITGDSAADERLSAIVNRAWRGDCGGALLVANDGCGEQTVYDDALELLRDVQAVLA